MHCKEIGINTNVLISIITVCKNVQSTIGNTIESVLMQECNDYEYIVVDGNSTDNTFSIVEGYCEYFNAKGNRFFFISENDNGIYNAMNKSLKYASGEYVCFLNADDSFYSPDVLEYVCREIRKYDYDIYYGKSNLIYENDKQYIQIPKRLFPHILGRMPFIHQASFTKKKLLDEHHFNEEYKVSADYDFFYYMFLKGKKFFYLDNTIVNYSMGGISNREIVLEKIEYKIIKKRNNTLLEVSLKKRILGLIVSVTYSIRGALKNNKIIFDLFMNIKKN